MLNEGDPRHDALRTARPTIVCPIDFSEPARASLQFATIIANHFGARLLVLAVEDPVLVQAAESISLSPPLIVQTEAELRRFASTVLDAFGPGPRVVEYRVTTGRPADEILGLAEDIGADLIVMSSHGRSGAPKLFFGSTTERVLHETTVPVLVTPDERGWSTSLSDIGRRLNRVVVPVDFSDASTQQVRVAAGIASAFRIPLVLAHVLEPICVPACVRVALPGSEATRRANAEDRLQSLARAATQAVATEEIVLSGDPSEQIVTLADARHAKLIVIGLHSSGMLGPRMGSVTYRVLCRTHGLVLALPPSLAPARETGLPAGLSNGNSVLPTTSRVETRGGVRTSRSSRLPHAGTR